MNDTDYLFILLGVLQVIIGVLVLLRFHHALLKDRYEHKFRYDRMRAHDHVDNIVQTEVRILAARQIDDKERREARPTTFRNPPVTFRDPLTGGLVNVEEDGGLIPPHPRSPEPPNSPVPPPGRMVD